MRRKENLSPELNENYKRSAQSKTVVILVENRYLTSGYRIKRRLLVDNNRIL